jgi:hypothetical protein
VNKISKAVVGISLAGIATLGVLTTTSASAATPDPVAGTVTALPAAPRLVGFPGMSLAANRPATLAVAGKVGVPVNATAVVIDVTSVAPSAAGSLTVWTTGAGQPGTPTISFGKGGASTAVAFVGLGNGSINVVSSTSTAFVLAVKGFVAPAPTPAATTFGVAQLQVDGTTWAQYEAPELGAPGGDQAAGTVRFTCRNATAGCDVSLKAFSTADGWTIYPRIVLEKEDNTSGAKLTCEYVDGVTNNGLAQPLGSGPVTVGLAIGTTADCGSTVQTTAGSVNHINVPGATGQGIHYDAFVTLTFARR